MTEGPLNSLLVRLIPPVVAWIMRVWFLTCRVTEHNSDFVNERKKSGDPTIGSFWHYSLLFNFFFQRDSRITAMISASRDGDYIAGLARQLRYQTVRGSKNKKGASALKAMLRAVKKGSSAAIVADGSQGPARIVQPGTILLASLTGVPVVPIVWSASRYFTIRSWDRTVVPKLFSKIQYYYGEPLHVPAKATPDEIESCRQQLEAQLNELYGVAWGFYNKTAH